MAIERTIAQRAYATRKRGFETNEEREYKFVQLHNQIFGLIKKMETSQDFIKIRNLIDVYHKESGYEVETNRLNKLLRERLESVLADLDEKSLSLNTKIQNLRKNHFVEHADTLRELNEKSNMFLLQLLTKMRTGQAGELYNRRYIGSVIVNANREQALAVLKLSQMDAYKTLLSEKQKELVLEKSKNPAEIIQENNNNKLIEGYQKELSQIYMTAFHLRNAQKQIHSATGYYFGNQEV